MKDHDIDDKSKDSEFEDSIIKKIKQLYSNYGIDVSDMSKEEFLRIRDQYLNREDKSLDNDLKTSEKYILVFAEKII